MSDKHATTGFAATVHGTVQGVGFRYYARSQARRLGVRGYVRNEPDGSVRVVCEGPAAAVDAMARWLESGPPSARVTRVDLEPRKPSGGFVVFDVEY